MSISVRAKTYVKRAANKLGYEVLANPAVGGRSDYGIIRSHASYSPWKTDADFRKVYEVIRTNTLVDEFRCWELWTLTEQAAKLDGAMLEVGVWRGGTGALIAAQAKRSGVTDRLYLCDTFEGVVKAGGEDTNYRGGEHADTSQEVVEKLLAKLDTVEVSILKGMFPEDTADQVTDERFRLCHIDVDVYQSARDVLEWVWPKLVVGGIVVYDDYGFVGCDGIVTHVEEQSGLEDRIVLRNLNGHTVLVKIA